MTHEVAMKLFGNCLSSDHGVFKMLVKTKAFAVDSHAPSFALCMPSNTFASARVVFAARSVAKVLFSGGFSNRFPSAISSIEMSMINIMRRFFAFHVNKSEAMRPAKAPVDLDHAVAFAYSTGDFASVPDINADVNSFTPKPAPLSGFWIVVKDRFEIVLGDIVWFGHGIQYRSMCHSAQ